MIDKHASSIRNPINMHALIRFEMDDLLPIGDCGLEHEAQFLPVKD